MGSGVIGAAGGVGLVESWDVGAGVGVDVGVCVGVGVACGVTTTVA